VREGVTEGGERWRFCAPQPKTDAPPPRSHAPAPAAQAPPRPADAKEAAAIAERAAAAQRARWPAASLAAADAAALAAGARCVVWDDGMDTGGAPMAAWVPWDWGQNEPAVSVGAGVGVGAAWWSLAAALGPPLVPATPLPPAAVAAWLDAHTVRVHGVWREGWGGGPARPVAGGP